MRGGVTGLSEPHASMTSANAGTRLLRWTDREGSFIRRILIMTVRLHSFHAHTAHLAARLLGDRHSVATHAHVRHVKSYLDTQ